jgi:hypothetical protein
MLPYLRHWAELLDNRFVIPGTSIRFGLDPILSLIPGLGDLVSPLFTVALLVQGLHRRVPRVVLLRMVGNALLDALIGAVPVAGNVGDIFWRANARNLALLERHAHPGRPPSREDYLFVYGLAIAFGLLIAIPFFLALWLAVLVVAGCGLPDAGLGQRRRIEGHGPRPVTVRRCARAAGADPAAAAT